MPLYGWNCKDQDEPFLDKRKPDQMFRRSRRERPTAPAARTDSTRSMQSSQHEKTRWRASDPNQYRHVMPQVTVQHGQMINLSRRSVPFLFPDSHECLTPRARRIRRTLATPTAGQLHILGHPATGGLKTGNVTQGPLRALGNTTTLRPSHSNRRSDGRPARPSALVGPHSTKPTSTMRR